MKPPAPTFIHLGLPKTATTTFQSHLFEPHSQIHYLGKYIGRGFPPSICPILRNPHTQPLELDPADIHMRGVREQLAYAAGRGLVPVLSKEGLAGGLARNQQKQAKAFVKILGNCKAILVVREPVSFIKSFYGQMLKAFQKRKKAQRDRWMDCMGTPPRFFDINEWLDVVWNERNTPRTFLSYADTARVYARILGRKNIRIFMFEEFVRNPEPFITDFCNHMGVDPKEGFDLMNGQRSNDGITTGYIDRLQEIEHSQSLTKQFHHTSSPVRRQLINPETLTGDKFRPKLSEEWQATINTFGIRQNRKLAKDWGLPLADYGYRL